MLLDRLIMIMLTGALLFPPTLMAMNPKYDLLIDASGSMQGFQQEKTTWVDFLEKLEKDAGHKFLFGDSYRKINGTLTDLPYFNDQNTKLGEHVEAWLNDNLSSNFLVIVTDNVADTGNKTGSMTSQNKMEMFLSGEKSNFAYVTVATMKLPFKGKIYSLNNNKKSNYQGQRAFVIYILGKTTAASEEYQIIKKKISSILNEHDSFITQVKPFSTEDVRKRGAIKINSNNTKGGANVTIKNGEDGNDIIDIKGYTLGNDLEVSFNSDVEIEGAYQLRDIEMEAELQLDHLPKHIKIEGRSEEAPLFKAAVKPSPVTLEPDKVQNFEISFKMGKIKFGDLSFSDKLAYTLKDQLLYDGKLQLKFSASKNQYEQHPQTFSKWSHDNQDMLGVADEFYQGKVFHLDTILREGIPDESTMESLQNYHVRLEVRYGIGPLIAGIALLTTIFFILYWLSRITRNQVYRLDDEMGKPTVFTIDFGHSFKHFDTKNDNILFTLTYWGIGFWLTSGYKLRGPRFLNEGQSFSIINSSTSDEYTWSLSKETSDEQDYASSKDHNNFWE